MKDRLSRIFNPKSGNTLMLAFDHGYISGASSGLERLDILIPHLAEDIDVFMSPPRSTRRWHFAAPLAALYFPMM